MENTTNEQRPLTFGEKAVGLTFNPSNDFDVQTIKELYAQIIDLCDKLRGEAASKNESGLSEKARLLSVAITEAQTAQMWAVKGITWKD
jgi:hypothetical protein